MPRSVIDGDHCHKFRAFSIFNKNLEIWDFPKNYFFNINHICLKAEFVGKNNNILIHERYPIKTKLFNESLELREEKFYSSLKIENDGAKLLLPNEELESISNLENTVSELRSRIKKLEDENLRLKRIEITIQEEIEPKIGPTYEIKSPIEQNKILEEIKSSIPPLKVEIETPTKPKDLVLLKREESDLNIKFEKNSDLTSYKLEEESSDRDSNERRKICPRCGNKNLSQIREIDDKTNLISAYYRLYGKKYKCGRCGNEWK